ncbi:MAG TPA: phosphatidate cytidylyltransferase, partial [Longimicrobiales bacterium]|nr:phosphatidate cytidylyltransferase [Longimicrobiales bacterium]
GWVLGVPLAVLAALGAGEVYRFARTKGVRPFRWAGMATAGCMVLAAVVRPDFPALAPWVLGLVAGLAVACLKLALVTRGPKGSPLADVSVTVFGAVYAGLPVAFVALLHAMPTRMDWGELRPSPWMGLMVVALPLAATWIGDAAAYFAGSAWGRKKLFPSVSPGKSWVGAWAGTLGAAAAGAGWFLVAHGVLPGVPLGSVGAAAAVGAVLGVAAIVGDLVESLLKREAGVKDSGRLFPGHGGVLDRLDALIFTLPTAYVLLWAAEHFA